MYLELKSGEGVLNEKNIFYEGDTSRIYKSDMQLYKIYLKKEKDIRKKLDILIKNEELRSVGILPNQKLHTDDDKYGMKMRYLPETKTFLKYIRGNYDINTLIEIMITLSDNLKIINSHNIHFSDLHHNNILIDKENHPWYIDFDDAVIEDCVSHHICTMCHSIHEIHKDNKKDYLYEEDLIQYGNLDREALFIMFINTLLGVKIEKMRFDKYFNFLEEISNYLPNDFLIALNNLKKCNPNDLEFPYYLGDYLKEEETKTKCLILRGKYNEHNNF